MVSKEMWKNRCVLVGLGKSEECAWVSLLEDLWGLW